MGANAYTCDGASRALARRAHAARTPRTLRVRSAHAPRARNTVQHGGIMPPDLDASGSMIPKDVAPEDPHGPCLWLNGVKCCYVCYKVDGFCISLRRNPGEPIRIDK